jgi:hypothetical protein
MTDFPRPFHGFVLLVFVAGIAAAADARRAPAASVSTHLRAPAVFEQLKSLAGEWKGTTAKGRELAVSYRLTAAGTVLVETWTLAPGRESMTLYHLDRDDLVATHYCPIGNQPSLRLKLPAAPGRFDFAFASATNLPDPKAPHQDSFTVELLGPDRFARSEAYAEGGVAGEAESVTYTRVLRPTVESGAR